MEAVPRLPMVSFQLKTSEEKPNFGPKIKQYIEAQYGEDGESFSNQLNQLEGLRASAVRPSVDVAGCSTLKKYYCQLHFLISRFPMGKGGAAAVTFSWRDPYSETNTHASDITLELASILYNIGALHSQLGAAEDRSNADTLRMACTHFQCAAWAFSHIVEEFPQVISYDPASEILSFMNSVCLAQAQECILEKGMLDNRKAAIVAKIAAQTVEFYRGALAKLGKPPSSSEEVSVSETVRSSTRAKWEANFKFKIAYYTCITLLYQGQQAEEEQKMGERVAYYAAAVDKLEEAVKLSKSVKGVADTLTFTQDVVVGKRKIAHNENEYIYHEQVPDVGALPLVKGAVLAKGTGFEVSDPDIAGADLFASLIPLKAHETSSVYSEMLAETMRSVTSRVQIRDEELQQLMSTIHVSEPPSPERHLPQPLIDRCAALSAQPEAVQNLTDVLESLTNTYEGVQVMLEDITRMLADEQSDAQEYEKLVGKRPPSIAATDLTREANKYQDAHAKASESNRTLKKALDMHISNLTVLSTHSLAEIDKLLPQVNVAPEYAAALQKMSALMSKVDEMRQQRSMLLGQLRDAIHHDDITAKIVTYQGDKAELCKKELAKHDAQINLINMNLSAQDAIMAAIEEAYPQYGEARGGLVATQKQRNAAINFLVSSYDAYQDLIAKSNKGLEFYNKLHANVSKLQQRVRSTCKVQQEERNQVMSTIKEEPKNNQGIEKTHGVLTDRIYNDVREAPVTQGLKLKDYLNMKKETGKMALVGPAGIRPAPVGSEVNDSVPVASFDGEMKGFVQEPAFSAQYGYGNGANPTSLPYSYQPPASQEHPYRPSPCGTPALSQTQPYNSYAYPSMLQPTTNQYVANVASMYSVPSTQSTTISSQNDFYPRAYESYPPTPYQNFGVNRPTTEQNQPTQITPYQTQNFGTTDQSQSPQITSYPSQNYGANRPATEQSQPSQMTSYQSQNFSRPTAEHSQPMYSAQQPYTHTESTPTHQTGTSSSYQPYQTVGISQAPFTGAYANPATYQVAPKVSSENTTPSFTAPTSSMGYGSYASYPDVYQNTQNPGQQNQVSYSGSYAPGSGYSGVYRTAPSPVNSIPSASPAKVPQSYASGAVSGVLPSAQPSTDIDTLSKIFQNATDFSAPQKQSSLLDSFVPTQVYQENTTPYFNQNEQFPGSTAGQSAYPAVTQTGSISSVPYVGQNTQNFTVPGNLASSNQSQQNFAVPGHQTSAVPTPQNYALPGNLGSVAPMNSQNYLITGNQASVTPNTQNYAVPGNQGTPTSHSQNYPAPASGNLASVVAQNSQAYVVPGNQASTTSNPHNFSVPGNAVAAAPQHAPSSTLDLLAGLDCSISQAPLVPSPAPVVVKKEPVKPEMEEQKKLEIEKPKPAEVVSTKVNAGSRRESISLEREALATFIADVDKLEKMVSALTMNTLNGPTSLDLKWKDIIDAQERESGRRSISVARCYPMKNRYPDILPYDDARIELPGTKDDYINASYLKKVCDGLPPVILTQAPLPYTYADFWTMVLQNNVEVIVCMATDDDLSGDIYWPMDREQPTVAGSAKVALQSCVVNSHSVQRVLSVTDGAVTRVVLHLQFTSWSSTSLPSSPGPLVAFAEEIRSLLSQQRSEAHPFVVHCTWGVGRTAVLTSMLAALVHIDCTATLPDVVSLVTSVTRARKNALRDREHLKFLYQSVLYYSQHLLLKRGILTNRTFEDNKVEGKCHTRHPSQDFVQPPSQPIIPSAETSVKSAVEEPALLAVMDPGKFTLTMTSEVKAKQKITKDNFNRPLMPPPADDPLRSLDPLWCGKKS